MTNEDWTKNFQKLTELSNLATEKQIEFYRSILVAGAGILGILISFIPHRHLAYISVGYFFCRYTYCYWESCSLQ